MGQYYMTVNLDKKEYLYPHKLGDGLKLMEFACSTLGTMTALALLLADGNGRGGGDMHSNSPLIGSWAGDRIVIAGDYADPGRYVLGDGTKLPDDTTLYTYCQNNFNDISSSIRAVMVEDPYIEENMKKEW